MVYARTSSMEEELNLIPLHTIRFKVNKSAPVATPDILILLILQSFVPPTWYVWAMFYYTAVSEGIVWRVRRYRRQKTVLVLYFQLF